MTQDIELGHKISINYRKKLIKNKGAKTFVNQGINCIFALLFWRTQEKKGKLMYVKLLLQKRLTLVTL